jgi:DNA polymerase-4
MAGTYRERVIMHVDMDAFFASVEQRTNPALVGKPVVVCGAGKRTVVTTASYEARPHGIKSGMPLFEAKKRCPTLLCVEADIPKYIDASLRALNILQEFTPDVEVYSIDEAFLDITGSLLLFKGAENIARIIKKSIKAQVGITCSIGIASNKLLAKLASDMEKPDGLKIIRDEEISSLLEGLPVEEMWGIGSRLAKYLNEMGIVTCGQLARIPVHLLERRFGIIGRVLHNMARGVDDSPVVRFGTEPDAKSMGHSMTVQRDLKLRKEISWYLFLLSEMLGRRLRSGGYAGRTVVLTLRYTDFHTFSRRMTLKRHINTGPQIHETAERILDGIRLRDAVRLVGVSLANLARGAIQIPLFEGERRKVEVILAMDRVNDRYGDFALSWGALMGSQMSRVVTPRWRPEERLIGYRS